MVWVAIGKEVAKQVAKRAGPYVKDGAKWAGRKAKEGLDAAKKWWKGDKKKKKKDEQCPTGTCPPTPKISRQKQDRHVEGTKENKQAIENGTPKSTFKDRETADRLTKEAWEKGTPVPNRPGVRDYDFGRPVGNAPGGGTQSTVRVHESSTGIHGHPSGPVAK
jgi:hypothetical protein